MKTHSPLLLPWCLFFCGFTFTTFAQQTYSFDDEKALENYSFLKDSTNLAWQEAIKYISLSATRNSYLTIGGSFRPRFEHFSNKDWSAGNNENYYSQRLTFHTHWHLGKFVRFFGEIYHGYKTDGASFLQTDNLDWHQGFVEIGLLEETNNLSIRLGRQEMKLGAGRLVDLREGVNIRRSFDLGKITFKSSQLNIDAFYGKEVQIGFEVFDNDFLLFQEEAGSPKLWGVYSQFSIFPNANKDKNTDLYYLGFQSNQSNFSDIIGKETRHSIGIRRFGTFSKRFKFNTEFIYQFGAIAGKAISAFNLETDWKYTFIHTKWRPTLGLKLDWSSGDRKQDDGKLNSFNPLFVNPSIYSLAALNTPVNLLSIHPSFIFFPNKKWMVNLEFATFFRSSEEDGLYVPPRFQTRPSDGISEKHIGNSIGLFLKYTHNRSMTFDIRSSYFISGDFIKVSGTSDNIFQFAPTIVLQF